MEQKYTNVREILQAAFAKGPYAKGVGTNVYELSSDAFFGASDYLIRVKDNLSKTDFDTMLNSTSSLTPVNLGEDCRKNFGQPYLLISDDIQIVKKISGSTLEALRSAGEPEYNEMMAKLPDETYRRYLEDILWLTDHGLSVDSFDSNIVLHNKDSAHPELRILDVLGLAHLNDESRRLLMGTFNKLPMILESAKFPKATAERLERIAKEMGFPLTTENVAERIVQNPITFARVNAIEHLSTLSLDSTPFEFQEKLKQVDAVNKDISL